MIYLFAVFGLLIGSFLNVLIYRLPLEQDFVFKRSHCPQCQQLVQWWMNIPVLSYLFLRAKCFYCQRLIHWRYPLVELLTGVMALYLAPQSLEMADLLVFAFQFSVFCLLLCHFFIDLDHYLLLDSLNLILLALMLVYSYLHFPWTHWVFGAVLGFGLTLLVTWAFYRYSGKVGLGGGDIKLFGILGLYLGPIDVLNNLLLSCLLGIVIFGAMMLLRKQQADQPMAFGPAILVIAFMQIYFPNLISLIYLY